MLEGPPEANGKRLGLEAGSPEAASTAGSGLWGWPQGEGAGGTLRPLQVPSSVSATGIAGHPTSPPGPWCHHPEAPTQGLAL